MDQLHYNFWQIIQSYSWTGILDMSVLVPDKQIFITTLHNILFSFIYIFTELFRK